VKKNLPLTRDPTKIASLRGFESVNAESADVTQLLLEWNKGDRAALDRLMPIVYDELRRLARKHLWAEIPGHTLQATGLVNEAYLRLVDQRRVNWQNRAHFFGAAAQIIRRILVDHARARNRVKRGGGALTIPLIDDVNVTDRKELDVVALDDALSQLAKLDPQQERIVELRFFTGLSIEDTAAALNVSPATIKRDWATARAWLYRQITSSSP
jgi:RNA polymerase sigma factor (TIGR02999 family)